MFDLVKDETSMASLLDSFKSTDPVVKQPNLQMSINSSETRNARNNKKRVVKTIKCNGKMVKKGGKFVPEVVCSTGKINIPNKTQHQEANRNNLLKEILGEVERNKEENEIMPFKRNEHPLGVNPPKSKKRPCGCKKKFSIEEEPPADLFPEMVMASNNVNRNNTGVNANNTNVNANNTGEDANNTNVNGNTQPKPKSKPKRKRSKKGRRKYKTIQLTVKGNEPNIPSVNVVRKKKPRKTKRKVKKSKATKPASENQNN